MGTKIVTSFFLLILIKSFFLLFMQADVSAKTLFLGTDTTNYFQGNMDEVKFYFLGNT